MSKTPLAVACGLFTLVSFANIAHAQTRPEADLCAVVPGAQPLLPARLLDGMGTTDMPVTTKSDEARKFFNQGVSQIHSFWFLESERSFLQAAALDPDMAMAYWGISVSAGGDYRPAFQLLRDPLDGGRAPGGNDSTAPKEIARSVGGAALSPAIRAREAIEKAMSLRDKVTPRERLYIEAEAARRNPQSKNKDADHIAGLRALVTAYPDDLEAKSILGLALLDGFESASKKPRTNTMEGLRLLEEVAAKDDNSFGAHHYLIHGWEGSTTPERAWHASKRYPELVPNIPHALHMPGHIYAQSDRIDDAIAAFAAAADNERSYMKADTLYPNGHHGHNVHFLIHALNLDGRYQDSMAQVAHLMNDFKETPRERRGNSQRVAWRQGYYALVKTLVRFERWARSSTAAPSRSTTGPSRTPGDCGPRVWPSPPRTGARKLRPRTRRWAPSCPGSMRRAALSPSRTWNSRPPSPPTRATGRSRATCSRRPPISKRAFSTPSRLPTLARW
jgi:hypothetical protein